MKKELLANCGRHDTRIALFEDGRLAELFFEQKETIKLVGNIYKGRIENIVPGISSAFVEIGLEKNGYLFINDALSGAPEIYNMDQKPVHKHREKTIDKIIQKGQFVIVQIDKEQIGEKGVKITMDISLPGRNIVYMPFQNKIGISRQIESKSERDRLKKMLETNASGGGFIIRTEAEGIEERELKRELAYLQRLWKNVLKEYHSSNGPKLLHKDLGLTFQMVRDVLSEDVVAYSIDSKSEYDDVKNFTNIVSPELANKVHHYQSKVPIFESHNVEREIDQFRKSKIPLPNGGSIIIQEAESLCAIDVNTGKFKGKNSQDETILMTNLEAAKEIARQLRLRNIGGIIVIDFIDMRKHKDRVNVVNTLKKATQSDKSRIKILPITRLGLVEMTRQRKRESIQSYISEECPECHGSGLILSKESLFIRITKEIEGLTCGRPGQQLKISLHPYMSEYFKEKRQQMERSTRSSVEIIENSRLSHQDYQILLQ